MPARVGRSLPYGAASPGGAREHEHGKKGCRQRGGYDTTNVTLVSTLLAAAGPRAGPPLACAAASRARQLWSKLGQEGRLWTAGGLVGGAGRTSGARVIVRQKALVRK
jgi:hypothetical protein